MLYGKDQTMPIPGLGGRGLTAEQILGMSTDEFKTKMDGAASKTDVTSLQSKVEETNTALSQIQASLAKLTAPREVPNPQTELDLNDPTTAMLTDPGGFINRQTMGMQATALSAKADVQEMRARQKYAGVFAKYGNELMETAKHFNVQARAMDGFWDQHIASFTGNKFLKGEMDSGSYPSLLGSSSVAASGSMGGEVNDPNFGFTPGQVQYFKDRGIPLEEAAGLRDLMHRDGEPIDIENYRKRVKKNAS